MIPQETDTKSRLLAKLIWQLLKAESFDGLADLTDALKAHCARLKITWTNDEISDAYRLIETNTKLPGKRLPRRPVEREPEPNNIIDRNFAARFMADLPTVIQTVKRAPWTDPDKVAEDHEAARLRALEMGVEL